MQHLTLCISTYNRPGGLEKLLLSITRQKGIEKYNTEISIAIADNQTPPATELIAERFRKEYGFPIFWQHEPTQGITFARNTSYKLAAGADLCLFVDDDEELDEYCIAELLRVKQEFKADMVYGNNPPVFMKENVPPWIKVFFESKGGEDGQELLYAATNCLLVDKAVLKGIKEPFDHGFRHSGGEDTFLTISLLKKGAKLVKSAKAKAYEQIPPERCSVKWILKRTKHEAAIFSLILMRLDFGKWAIPKRLIKLMIKLIRGLLLSILYFVFTRKKKLTGLMLIWDAVGGYLGFVGYQKLFTHTDITQE